jgi:hypothetical protein
MKQIKTKNKKQPLLFIALAVLLVALTSAAFYYFNNKSADQQNTSIQKTPSDNINQIDNSPPSEEESKNGYDNKKDFIDNIDQPVAGSVTVAINSVDQDDSSLFVNVLVYDNNPTGKCTLTLNSHTETVSIDQLPSYGICRGFTVPLNKLLKGKQEVIVTYSSDTALGKVVKTVEIK